MVLTGIAVAAVVSRSSVLGPGLIRLASKRLEQITGCQVEVERVAGSWYDGLELEGLEMIARREGAPLRYLRGRARAGYSLLGLLTGDEGALESLDLDLDELVLDLSAGKGGGPGPTPPMQLPPGSCRIREGEVLLPGSRSLEIGELTVRLDPAQQATAVEREAGQRAAVNVPRVTLLQEDKLLWEGEASLRSVYRAGLVEITNLDFISRVDRASGGIRQGRLDLRGLPEHSYSFRLPFDTLGGIVNFEGRVRGRVWSVRAGARELALDPLASLASRLVPGRWVEAWPGGILEGSLSLRFELPEEGRPCSAPMGEVTAHLRDGYVLGHPCDALYTSAVFDADGLVVDRLDLVGPVLEGWLREPVFFTPPEPVVVTSDSWPLPLVPPSVDLSGAMDGSVFDLPAFLAGPISKHFRLAELIPDPLEPLTGCVGFGGSVSGTLAEPRVELEIEGQGMATEAVPWGRVALRIETERGGLRMPYLSVDGPMVTAVGGLEFPAPGEGWIWMAGHVHDMEHVASVAERFGPELQLGGEADFDLDWYRVLRLGHLDLRARSQAIAFGETDLRELDVRLTGDHGNLLVERGRVVLDRTEEGISQLPHGPVEVLALPDHQLAVRRDEEGSWNVEAQGLWLGTSGERLELTRQAALRYDFTTRDFAASAFPFAMGTGSVEVEGSRSSEQLHARLGFIDFDSEPWLAPFLPAGASLGRLDGGLSFSLGKLGPSTLTDLEARDLRWPDVLPPKSKAYLRVHQQGEHFEVENMELLAPGYGSLRIVGTTDLDPEQPFSGLGELPAELRYQVHLDDPRPLWSWIPRDRLPTEFAAAGDVTLEGVLAGDGTHLSGTCELRCQNLYASAAIDDERAIFGPADLGASFVLDQEGLHLVEADFDATELRAQARGRTFGPVPQDPEAFRAYWREVEADESGSLQITDLSWLADWLPTVRRMSGSLTAALPPREERRADAPFGRVFLTDGLVRFRGTELFVQSLNGELRIDGPRLVLPQLVGEFGASVVEVSGTMDLSTPRPYFDLGLRAKDLLLARSRGLLIRADAGTEDEGLRVVGPLDAIEVSGRLSLRNSRFTRQYDLLSWLSRREKNAPETGEGIRLRLAPEGPLANMSINVEISGGDPFRIDNNLVESSLRPDLRLMGTGKLAFLQGPIYVDPSYVTLPSGKLEVTGGTVVFGAENPFVPRLDISAEQRIRGYDITVSVSGTTQQPEITISSNPPLPGDDVFVLLLTGQIPRGSWGDKTERAGQVLAVYLAKDALVRAFGDDGASESALDRLELTLGQDVSRQGVETMHFTYRLGPRPKGTGITNYLTAERDEYDKENFGYRVLFRFR